MIRRFNIGVCLRKGIPWVLGLGLLLAWVNPLWVAAGTISLAGILFLISRYLQSIDSKGDGIDILSRHARQLGWSLPSGLLLIDNTGHIAFANQQALQLFGLNEREARGVSFDQLRDGETRGALSAQPVTERFRKNDGTRFHAYVSESRIEMEGCEESQRPRLVMINDATPVIDLQKKTRREERQRTAVTLASQFAHAIRNPVAVISGSAQVLDRMSRKQAERPGLVQAEQAELYQCIVKESDRLDSVITEFLSAAEASDDRLEKLLEVPVLGGKTPACSGELQRDTSAQPV